VRFFPDNIFVCINKIDLIKEDAEKKVEAAKTKITEFFKQRKITVKEFFITCAESVEGFEDVQTYNDRTAEMILKITIDSKPK
jgi:translation elongation factor EF-1alpha